MDKTFDKVLVSHFDLTKYASDNRNIYHLVSLDILLEIIVIINCLLLLINFVNVIILVKSYKIVFELFVDLFFDHRCGIEVPFMDAQKPDGAPALLAFLFRNVVLVI